MIRLRNKSSSGGAYARDKNTSAELCAKNAGGGGGLCAKGGVFAGHYGSITICLYRRHTLHCFPMTRILKLPATYKYTSMLVFTTCNNIIIQ